MNIKEIVKIICCFFSGHDLDVYTMRATPGMFGHDKRRTTEAYCKKCKRFIINRK